MKISKTSWDYHQPDFYKFSEDSIYLAKHALTKIEENISILDVGSGCGVVGFEILRLSKFKLEIDFLEIQKVFKKYFEANKLDLGFDNATFIEGDFKDLKLEKKYQLIVSNPPYFLLDENRLGLNENKNICRFFLKANLDDLLAFFKRQLSLNGVGLFLCRENALKILNSYAKDFKFNLIKKDEKTYLVEVFPLNIK